MSLSQITFDFIDPEPQKGAKKKMKKQQELKDQIPKIKSTRGRKSLKQHDIEADLIDIPDDETLFKKLYYPIGDVAAMFRVNPSLVRYWANEFDVLKPKKNAKGDRFFRPEDIKTLKLIHHLLRDRKYTIEGAKEFLKNNRSAQEKYEMIMSLQKLKSFLLELKTNL